MPKYRKDRKYVAQKEGKKREGISEIGLMYKSSVKTYIVAIIFLVLSIIFNMELVPITFGPEHDTLFKILVYGFRGVFVIGFFLFAFISWGNLMELRGGLMGLKEIIILIVISLMQTVRNPYVFLAASVGIFGVCIYIWLM